MLKINKYLKEIGIDETSWPFEDIKENKELKEKGRPYDKRYIEGGFLEGFVDAECFSLNDTLSKIIYSYLCYFRDYGADYVTPICFCYNESGIAVENGHEKWMKVLDDMIIAFKLLITNTERSKRTQRRIKYGLRQFIKYYECLWW